MANEEIQNIILMNGYFAKLGSGRLKALNLPPGATGLLYGGYLKTTLELLQSMNGDAEGALVALLQGAGVSIEREKKLRGAAYLTDEEMHELARISKEAPGALPYFIKLMKGEQLAGQKARDAAVRAREAHRIVGDNTLEKVLAGYKTRQD